MRKALIVGIDHYTHLPDLSGCVNDAHAVKQMLERHADGTINFGTPLLMTGTGPNDRVERGELRRAVRELFEGESEIALFYFAGHGHVEDTGGFLCTSENEDGDDGLAMSDIVSFAAQSPARNKILILDSCHSGAAGSRGTQASVAEIADGMTILTASTANQYAVETVGGGSGVFTSLLVDALGGAAANLVGDITPGSIYAHVDQSLGNWGQRPVFKTNVKTFVSLRKATAPIALSELLELATHFPRADYEFPLDPGYEPERSETEKMDPSLPPPDPVKTAVFKTLQNYVKVNLVRPIGAEHMWHAAMGSKSCRLTVLGQHYRSLVEGGLI